MAKMDDFLKNLQQMDSSQLQTLAKKATANLTPAQQTKLKKLLSDPKALEKLQSKLTDQDVTSLQNNIASPESLENYMRSSDVQKRIDEILK